MAEKSCRSDDLVCGRSAIVLWYLPVIALVVGAYQQEFLPYLWVPAFLLMGGACVVNAARCRRVHCYITGPVFLLSALYVVLAGLHKVPMQPGKFLIFVFATTVLAHLLEIPLGRYSNKK
ncbi:MAG: hypothetical protein QJR10_10170 [Bacillota bacterium]|nr:hypothetical protein [Bacillota bacterium]